MNCSKGHPSTHVLPNQLCNDLLSDVMENTVTSSREIILPNFSSVAEMRVLY